MYIADNVISNRITKIMFDLRINQDQLAKILNITQPAVSKYLKGRVPPPNVLLQLSKLSGMSIEWILTGTTETKQKSNIIFEESEQYHTSKTIEEKFNLLSLAIQRDIETLIDSILKL